jgi:drug/metabolite transporter (DMT)-like permease
MSLHQSSGRWQLGLCLALTTVLLWGFLAVALKITLQVVDAHTLTWFRFIVAFGLLAMFLASKQQLPNLKQLKSGFLKLLGIATVALALNYILFLEGLARTSPNNAQVLIQLAPVMLGVSSLYIFKERYSFRQWFGLGVLIAGICLFSNEQVHLRDDYLFGNILLVLAAIAWVIYGLAQKQLLQVLSSPSIMLCIYGGSALLFTPFAVPAEIVTIPVVHLGLLLFCAVNTLFAYGCFAEALEHWEASRVSAVLSLTPLVTMGASILLPFVFPQLLQPEPLSILSLGGGILVVLGSLTISLGTKPKTPVAD